MGERRAQILAVAREEFLTRGFAGARIQDIADTAGVTHALIYKHFEGKEELFEEAILAPLHTLLGERLAEMKSLPTDAAGTAQYESMLRYVRTLLQLFTEAIDGLGVVLFGERDHARKFYVRHIDPLMAASIEVGRVNLPRWPHRDYDITTAVQAMFGMAFWIALDRSMRGADRDLEIKARELTDLIMYGVVA